MWLVLGVLIFGLGHLYYAKKIARYPVAAPIIGFGLVVTGIAVAGIGIHRLVRRPMVLIVDREGVVPDARHPERRLLWSDLRGARYDAVEVRTYGSLTYGSPINFRRNVPIIALDLVDAQKVYARWAAVGRPWLGYDTGVRSDLIPLYYKGYDTDAVRLMRAIQAGIMRHGRPGPANANSYTAHDLFVP